VPFGGRAGWEFESVAAAFELVDRIWPQAALRVAEQTWLVVPVEEWGTVSYSSPRLPGVTFVNVRSSPMIRLAEDLLHEATHQRLHDIETRGPLLTPLAVEGGDEPRYYSPWRREWRPLRGLLHAACTFTTGARFFERSLAAASSDLGHVCPSGSRTLWLARRLLEEMHDVTIALAALRSAAREGLLTPTGRRLASEVRREHRRLAPAAAVARKCLSSSAQGRVEIDRLERHVRRLAKHPFRW
jgi:HEXXH motif-containing protein